MMVGSSVIGRAAAAARRDGGRRAGGVHVEVPVAIVEGAERGGRRPRTTSKKSSHATVSLVPSLQTRSFACSRWRRSTCPGTCVERCPSGTPTVRRVRRRCFQQLRRVGAAVALGAAMGPRSRRCSVPDAGFGE